jgi:hypothetical protein
LREDERASATIIVVRFLPALCHVDEFQTFSSEAFASLLSEARKFATHFCLANQYTDQLSLAVRSAVLENARTLVAFRLGSRDAELLEPEFRLMDPGGLADQEPFTAWLRRGVGRDRIFAKRTSPAQLRLSTMPSR